jgi:hypothetical protein
MDQGKVWFRAARERPSLTGVGMGALRVSLLFGMAGIALALLAAPFAENQARDRLARSGVGNQLDFTSTGTARASSGYTLRRSVLQPHPGSVCIIRDNGIRSGEC